MKIANKYTMLGISLLALCFSFRPVAVLAAPGQPPAMQAAPPVIVPPSSVSSPMATPPVSSPNMVAQNAVAKIASPMIGDPPLEAKTADAMALLPGGKKDADLPGGKIPDSVKDIVKRLNSGTENITLDNLNSAREAVAKLDALIEIEKRLADLDKVRSQREKENGKMYATAIPARELAPPPAYIPPPLSQPMQNFMPPSSNIEVLRIEGSNSHYAALIKEGDQPHLMHVGDHLADGSVIHSVSTRGVELEKGKTRHVVQVKDVQTVFGGGL